MFRDVMQLLEQEISGQAALGYVAEIGRFHRIQASPGFRRAAEYVCGELRKLGVQAEVLSFPANCNTRFWGAPMFQEWDAQEGTCDLVIDGAVDRRLADYREDKISILQRSASADLEAEIVAVDGGADEADYAGLDVTGKVVLVSGGIGRVLELAVRKRGAVAVLYDGMHKLAPVTERIDYADNRQYTGFGGRGADAPSTGFVLTPRQGDELRAMIRQRARQGKPAPRARIHVKSVQYDGAIEVVSALIPGTSSQEIVLEAHLCHPQMSANDNGSGSAVLIEVARVLSAAIRDGRLAQPARSIRFLWIPEMTGTYAYLATHEADISKMVAALNLDMVGEDQDKCRSFLALIRTPMATASFASTVLEWIFEQYRNGGKSRYSLEQWPTFRVWPTPFSSGSDHYIMSDPTVGVPSPMLGVYPDKYWHTNGDTLDKVDPKSLGFAGNLSAGYAYWLATAGAEQARWLADEMTARYRKDVIEVVQAWSTQVVEGGAPVGPNLPERVGFLLERHEAALGTLSRLAAFDPSPWRTACMAFAGAELEAANKRFGGKLQQRAAPAGEWEDRAARMVPKRVFRGPVEDSWLDLTPDDKEALYRLANNFGDPQYLASILAMYWMDGRRTLKDICELVELEAGVRPTESLVRHTELLARGGGIELLPAKS